MPKNPIDQFLEDLERELLSALNPTASEEGKEEGTAPAAPENERLTELSAEEFIRETIRALDKAEEAAAQYGTEASGPFLAIADRYIVLAEMALHFGG